MVNWRRYNQLLVRRGEVILDFDLIDGWQEELLEKMNDGGKEGALSVPRIIRLAAAWVHACARISIYRTDRMKEV
jgi:hypothetical protein